MKLLFRESSSATILKALATIGVFIIAIIVFLVVREHYAKAGGQGDFDYPAAYTQIRLAHEALDQLTVDLKARQARGAWAGTFKIPLTTEQEDVLEENCRTSRDTIRNEMSQGKLDLTWSEGSP